MGYRSDVHALFYTTTKEEWPLLKLFMDENFPFDKLDEPKVIERKHLWGYEVKYEDVKWYSDYEDVKAFDAFKTKYLALLDAQEENGKEWAFEFIRIGEDTEDVECENSMASVGVLSVRRSIEADY